MTEKVSYLDLEEPIADIQAIARLLGHVLGSPNAITDDDRDGLWLLENRLSDAADNLKRTFEAMAKEKESKEAQQ